MLTPRYKSREEAIKCWGRRGFLTECARKTSSGGGLFNKRQKEMREPEFWPKEQQVRRPEMGVCPEGSGTRRATTQRGDQRDECNVTRPEQTRKPPGTKSRDGVSGSIVK